MSFQFLNNDLYQKDLKIEDELARYGSYYKRSALIDFDIVGKEIAENDPDMLTFIDEVRDDLTFLANGVTPVSIYDRIAQLCFFSQFDKFILEFSRAQSVKLALNHNLILKKLNSEKPKE